MIEQASPAGSLAIGELSVRNFRTYAQLDIRLAPGLNVFCGPNGVGKTNLLEACAMVLSGASPRTSAELRCIRHDEAFVRVAAQVSVADIHSSRAVSLAAGTGKKLELDGTPCRSMAAFSAAAPVVTFLPERLLVMRGAPARRRQLLDRLVEQIHPPASAVIRDYAHAVSQRNTLLRQARAGRDVSLAIQPWTDQLLELGVRLRAERAKVVELLAPRLGVRFEELTGMTGAAVAIDFRGPQLASALLDAWSADVRRGSTTVGPHLDDIRLEQDGRDLRAFGSTGEQRAALLAWSLAAADLIAQNGPALPVLILDEPYAELDADRRRRLTALLDGLGQVLVTTTEPPDHMSGPAATTHAALWQVSSGEVTEWTTPTST